MGTLKAQLLPVRFTMRHNFSSFAHVFLLCPPRSCLNHIFSMAELFQFCTALSNEIIFLDVTAAMVRETELEGGLKSH